MSTQKLAVETSKLPPFQRYECGSCGKSGVKCWKKKFTKPGREVDLYCAKCAARHDKCTISHIYPTGMLKIDGRANLSNSFNTLMPAIQNRSIRSWYVAIALCPTEELQKWQVLPNE